MMNEITRPCRTCQTDVSIDDPMCPECRTFQYSSKKVIAATAIIGLLYLPITYRLTSLLSTIGFPTDRVIVWVAVAFAWGIAFIGPLFLVGAVVWYLRRRSTLNHARSAT